MNRTHRLVSNTKKKNRQTATTLPAPNKYALINLCLALILGGILCIALYTPFTYSTLANNRIIKHITDAITEEYGGIVASSNPVEVEGYDFKVKCSQDYIMENGDEQLAYLERFKELGILKTNVDIDDLWAVYYTYYSSDYNDNIELYQQLVAWYSGLNEADNGDATHTCDGKNCKFVNEMQTFLLETKENIITSNAHLTYHVQIAESAAQLALTETELQQAYEAYILSSPQFIDKLVVDFTVLNQTLLTNNIKLANWAINSDEKIVNTLLGEIKYTTEFNSTDCKEVLRYIETTLDEEIITDEIVEYVPNALMAYATGSSGISTGNTTIVNITNVENIEEWLAENEGYTQYKDAATDVQFIDLGYAQLHWDISSIDYVENIPTFEECSTNAEWVNTIRNQLVEQAVWQQFYSGEE